MKQLLTTTTILFSAFTYAQDNSEKIVDVAYDACDCIGKIQTNLSKEAKSEAIQSCITSANMSWQLTKSMSEMTEKVSDTLSKVDDISKIDSLTIPSDDLNIIITDSDYDEIESYLYETCGDMESIYFTDDEESENSYSDKEKAMEYYNQGLVAFDNQDYKKALSFYKKAVKEDKQFAFAWDNLGRTHRQLNNFKEAVKCYKKSLRIDPKGGMPLMNIAVAYGFLEEFDKAKKAYRQYGKVFKDDPETYFGLGRIYTIEGDYENGLDNMMQAYILYINMNSPYKKDAEKYIVLLAKQLEESNKLDVLQRLSKKYKIELVED
ncbi:tetratricopeptide repeat protein [Olleya sp. R77988]|uniref:tetratricopeptide repeat protein n=1 Tax=Olleya sp. R77988 TaxID=3093875 RepID=UPI0037C71400